MECGDLAERLTDLMEGDLGPDEEAAALAHLASCDRCERVLAETTAAIGLVTEHGRPELSAQARERLWGLVEREVRSSGGSARPEPREVPASLVHNRS